MPTLLNHFLKIQKFKNKSQFAPLADTVNKKIKT